MPHAFTFHRRATIRIESPHLIREAWIEQMEHDGIPANVVTYNSVTGVRLRDL